MEQCSMQHLEQKMMDIGQMMQHTQEVMSRANKMIETMPKGQVMRMMQGNQPIKQMIHNMGDMAKNMNSMMQNMQQMMNDPAVMNHQEMKKQMKDMQKNVESMVKFMDGVMHNVEQVQNLH
jgi:hypothetical protein